MGVVFSGQLAIARHTSEVSVVLSGHIQVKVKLAMFYKSGCGLLWTASFTTRVIQVKASLQHTCFIKVGVVFSGKARFTARAQG